MLYSKNGSIPYPNTDGTDGWIEVPDAPTAPEGMEVVWWYPPGWVVRPVEPAPVEGHAWTWSQSDEKWNSYQVITSASEPAVVIDMTNGADSIAGGV